MNQKSVYTLSCDVVTFSDNVQLYIWKGGVILEKLYHIYVGPNCCRTPITKFHVNVAFSFVGGPQKSKKQRETLKKYFSLGQIKIHFAHFWKMKKSRKHILISNLFCCDYSLVKKEGF